MSRWVALGMSFLLLFTSWDLSVFAMEAGTADKRITAISGLSHNISNQEVETNTNLGGGSSFQIAWRLQ